MQIGRIIQKDMTANKVQYIFLPAIFIICCKKVDDSNQNHSKAPTGIVDSGHSMPSKMIVCDISEDSIKDTISVTAYNSETLGYNFEIKIKYSLNGRWKVKTMQSGQYTCAFDWGFESTGKWMSVGYSTDRKYRDYYDISFEKSEDRFYLRRHVGVYPSTIDKKYDIFDDGSITVTSLSFRICKTEYEHFAIADTISLSKANNTECIELPYEETTSNMGIVKQILGLNELEPISAR